MWKAYLEYDLNAFHREDYLFAQIAAEVRRGLVKNPEKVTINDMLVKFNATQEKKLDKDATARTLNSKLFWFAVTGVKEPIN